MKIFGCIVLMLFSTVALADWNGEWIGCGADKLGSAQDITVSVRITKTHDSITIEKGSKDAQFYVPFFGTYDIDNAGNILRNRSSVGSVTDSSIAISYYQFSFNGKVPSLYIQQDPTNPNTAILSYTIDDVYSSSRTQDFSASLERIQ